MADQYAALDARLAALAPAVVFPETPDLVARIGALPERDSRRDTPARPILLGLVSAAAALAVVFGSLLSVSSEARAALDSILEVGGLSITSDGSQAETPGARQAQLGRPASLEELSAFPFEVHQLEGQGPPSIYINELERGTIVTLVYDGPAGDRILFTQFIGHIRAVKDSPGSQPRDVTVNGQLGYWLPGPHTIAYPFESGDPPVRVVGNVLFWQQDSVVYRIESNLSLPQALELAGSLR